MAATGRGWLRISENAAPRAVCAERRSMIIAHA
jgi:hypothetical protein